MKTHVTVLGVLHIVFGVLGVLLAIGLLVLFGGIAGVVATQDLSDDEGAEFAIPVLGTLGVGLFVLVSLLSLPSVVIGYGLVKFRGWARIGGLVLSALDLFHIPFGTALGIYGFWVLLSRESEALFSTAGTAG